MEHWRICNCGNKAHLPKEKLLIRYFILSISLHTTLFECAVPSVTKDTIETTYEGDFSVWSEKEDKRSRCGLGQLSRLFHSRDQIIATLFLCQVQPNNSDYLYAQSS